MVFLRINANETRRIKLLKTQANNIQSLYQQLDQRHTTLTDEYSTLQNQYNALGTDYKNLFSTYSSAVSEYNALVDRYNSLAESHNMLANEHAALENNYLELDRIAIKPPYIFVHDREIDMAFYGIGGNLIHWVTPFENLEYYIEEGYQLRTQMINQTEYTYSVYTNNDYIIDVYDFSVFLTPGNFENVIVPIYEKASSDRDFITQVWQIVGQLSNYTSEDNQEIPRFPSETMFAGGGDCEDLAILFASMIQAAPTNWYVDLVYVDSGNILYPITIDHVIVYINTGWETYLVETTSDITMEPYPNGVSGWLARQLRAQNDTDRYPVELH